MTISRIFISRRETIIKTHRCSTVKAQSMFKFLRPDSAVSTESFHPLESLSKTTIKAIRESSDRECIYIPFVSEYAAPIQLSRRYKLNKSVPQRVLRVVHCSISFFADFDRTRHPRLEISQQTLPCGRKFSHAR